MYLVTEKTLFTIFKFAFKMGLLRKTALSDKTLQQECKAWIDVHLANKEPSEEDIRKDKAYGAGLAEPYH